MHCLVEGGRQVISTEYDVDMHSQEDVGYCKDCNYKKGINKYSISKL